jgi:CDP-glycerol glycerophosphotransferase (TagB/SpsB family)
MADEDEHEDVDRELQAEENKVLDDVIIVYSYNGKIKYCYCDEESAYKKIIKFRYKVIKLSLSKRKLKLTIAAYLINKHGLNITNQKLYIDQVLGQDCKIKETDHVMSRLEMLKTNSIYVFTFKMKNILQDVSEINGNMRMSIEIDGKTIDYRIGIKDKKIKNPRYYYSPMKPKYIKDYAVHFRRTTRGNLVLVKRLKEPIENTFKFRFMESKVVSNILYAISKVLLKLRKKKINLYYEKFSSKAEEGAYDLFLMIRDKSSQTKNYFIIDKDSEDYAKIKHEKNVVKKYSVKYYWLVFNASNFISTEAPIHLNILRSNNTALRRSTCDKKFIFLQHGITYMKCQGDGSTFAKNKEGEASYIIVGSEKEKDAVVDMLKLNDEQVLNTGLPIFSKIDFKHINENSDDIVTVMLTWKPYEEQLYNFEESTYYKNTVEIYEMLTKYIDKEKIVIIPHPKVFDLLTSTDMKDSVWQGKISEILAKTKMLITDYSSVCYNSFYQGGGVVFYQPDLELYEAYNGPLVPTDDEYVGKRAFNMKQLEDISKEAIVDGKVDLSKLRNKKFEDNYATINEFSDGKNIERIYEKLKELEIIK